VPTSPAEPRWERVPDQQAFVDSSMVAVAGGPDRYVAVGEARLADDQGVGMTWTSTDGVAWRRASAPLAGGDAVGVIHDRVGYVAWGGGVVFWTSPDGESWSRASVTADPGSDERVTGVARLGNDLIAVGIAEIASGNDVVHEFRTWTSPDGLAWKSVSPVTSIPWDGSVDGVTASKGALVAWGYARVGDQFPPVSLRSTDGRQWEVGGTGLKNEAYQREGIIDIVGEGGHLVAVGHGPERGAGPPPPPSAAWTSADGLAWTPAQFRPEPSGGWLLHVAWWDGEYVALGLSGIDPVVWRSVDGTIWMQSESAPDAGRDGEAEGCVGGRCPFTVVNDLAGGPAGLVAVGGNHSTSGHEETVVWIAATDGH